MAPGGVVQFTPEVMCDQARELDAEFAHEQAAFIEGGGQPGPSKSYVEHVNHTRKCKTCKAAHGHVASFCDEGLALWDRMRADAEAQGITVPLPPARD